MKGHFTHKTLMFVAALLALRIMVWTAPQVELALRQIVLASEQEVREVRASLIAGASFETLASERSLDTTAQRGGYVGRTRLADLRSEVRSAVETLAAGEVSNPIRIGNTFVLFQNVPEAESRWIDLDEAGAQALAEGRNAEAATRFEQALAHAETSALGDARVARSLDSLATVYRLEGRAADAEKLYHRALALMERMGAPELEIAQILNGLGMALVKQSRFREAEPVYERARSIREKRLEPDHPEVAATLHNIAEVFSGLGRFVDAAKLYEQSQAILERKLGPSHPATITGAQSLQAFQRSLMPELLDRFSKVVSLSEFRDGEFAQTIVEIRELLPLAPVSEYSFVQMKNILFEVGLSNETEDVLRSGLDKFPHSRLLRIYLADVLAETGRTQNALGVLEEAYRLPRAEELDAATDRQQQAVIQQRIGDMHSALSNLDGAVSAYLRSLEIDPAAPAGLIKLGRAYFSSNRLEEALAQFERAVRETPKDSEANLNLAEAHLASGHWEQAAAAAQHAIELGASDPRALYLLGTAMVRTGRIEQGQERLREFARVESDFQDVKARNREIAAINMAAIGALREGDGNAAIRRLTEGIKRFPDAGRLHMNLAMVQSRLGRHQMAIEGLESMLDHGIGQGFLIHKTLADEYEILGNAEAARRHRRIYLDTRESELIVKVTQ